MQIIQGFVTKNSFILNTGSDVNEFFELSPMAMTYSKTRGEYQDSNTPGDILHVFVSKDTTTGENFELTTEVSKTFTIIETVYSYCISHSFDSDSFINYVKTACATLITTFTHGDLYEGTNFSLPDWCSWTDTAGTEYRIWLRDAAFRNQYPFTEIQIVPPVDDLDAFFASYSALAATLSALPVTDIIDRAQSAKASFPESIFRVQTYTYYNSANTNQHVSTAWGVLIYGQNGDNIDSIKDAIVDYILTNSSHTESEWQVILPEIFERTEFLIFPRWDKIAIENTTDLSSIYKTVFSPSEMTDYVSRHLPSSVEDTFLSDYLQMMPFGYKGLTAAVLPGTSNAAGAETIDTVFSDYYPASTSDLDFNRMSLATRTWVIKMIALLRTAETATAYSSLENPMRRITRNGQLFIAVIYNNINYLVSAKSNNNV